MASAQKVYFGFLLWVVILIVLVVIEPWAGFIWFVASFALFLIYIGLEGSIFEGL